MIDFANELRKAYDGDAWHGNNISAIILSAKDDQVFKQPIPDAHSIAEIVMHLTSWTEEVISRLMDNAAKEPSGGDWPAVQEGTKGEWDSILSNFHIANEKLINLVFGITNDQWKETIDRVSGTKINKFELFNGLIQHHAYHAGQIALLLKFK